MGLPQALELLLSKGGLAVLCEEKEGNKIPIQWKELVEHVRRKHASTFAHLINAQKLIAANSEGFCPWDRFAYKSCVLQSSFVEAVVAVGGVQGPGASSPGCCWALRVFKERRKTVPNYTTQHNTSESARWPECSIDSVWS